MEFFELESAEQIQGRVGGVWVVGIDRDPPPYGDGKPKILCHMGRGDKSEPFTAAAVADKLARGDRVFFAHPDNTDRYGLPTDPLQAKVIRQAVADFAAE